ncbi:MAG: macro domain-containing protein [Actinomycetota bacterium]|nr:macro domain-containing protein [Actinomycetota bacterium]
MIQETHGNLLDTDADALVNTVNTVGVMGKGIALQFKRAFPANYKAYKRASNQGAVELGRMFIWDAGPLGGDGPRYVINFPTKQHWRSKSKLSDIRAGLDDLVRQLEDLSIKSIAVPPLGCGNGGLRWDQVRPLIEQAFEQVPDVTVFLFPPEGAPAATEQPVRTETPKMTPGRAALIGIMQRYLPFAVEITAVDIQKVMYFMQESGEPLRLKYAKSQYGPYADNLRQVLSSMEGHYIRGTGDGSAKALDSIPFEILDAAKPAAAGMLAEQPETSARMDRVTRLIEGFESTYGLELLATVHWAAQREEDGRHRVVSLPLDQVERVVGSWTRRKERLFTPPHIAKAYDRLRQQGWLDPDDSAGLFANT